MTLASDIRLVCFDLGGVVVEICRTWEEGCSRAGIPLKAPLTSEWLRAFAGLSQRLELGELSETEFQKRMSAATGGLYSAAEVRAIETAWIKAPYAGVAELVRELDGRGIPTAALSNLSPAHWEPLRDLEAVRSMRYQFLSFRLGLVKPMPAFFAAVEAETRILGPAIVFFDDTAANVSAARACGWRSERIDFSAPTAPQMRKALDLFAQQ
jgi:glucose-1-phosphatase